MAQPEPGQGGVGVVNRYRPRTSRGAAEEAVEGETVANSLKKHLDGVHLASGGPWMAPG